MFRLMGFANYWCSEWGRMFAREDAQKAQIREMIEHDAAWAGTAAALGHGHDNIMPTVEVGGQIHRDLKPDNVPL